MGNRVPFATSASMSLFVARTTISLLTRFGAARGIV
jgi:hypothetical protein